MVKKKQKAHDRKMNKVNPNGFVRTCINCKDRGICKKEPPKNSIKRYKEFCGSFVPDYGRIDRVAEGRTVASVGGWHKLANENTYKRFAVNQAADILDEVNKTLNKS